ncbi:hypothetical protein FRC07_013067 [Ceratobasidium sp. 392]|nr:hypothetical protein FRC07_013067 [Ceratobasidium sp. 392]
MITPKSTVIALYRASLRESQKLFDPLVRYAFTDYIRNRFRRNVRITDEGLRYKKIKTAKARLRHLQAANAGTKQGIAWALRFAYGTSGPLQQRNLKTLKDFGGPHNQDKQARPPPFHPALYALLSAQEARIKTNSKAQSNGPVELASLLEQRNWLGKLPERREKNLWWRWWRAETAKIQAPAEIEVAEPIAGVHQDISAGQAGTPQNPSGASGVARSTYTNSAADVKKYGLLMLKTQGTGLNYRVEQLIGNRAMPNPPRRSPERTRETATVNSAPANSLASPQPRFYRRRYRDVLSKMPFLSFKPAPSSPQNATSASETQQPDTLATPNVVPGKYSVRISTLAAPRGKPRNRVTYSVMSEEDHQWIQRAREASQQTDSKHKNT